MARKRRGRQARKARAGLRNEEDRFKDHPHSFVFSRGNVGRYVRQLTRDVRRIMEPFTATRLQTVARNSLSDFIHAAGPLGVTHCLIFSQVKSHHPLLRIIKSPRGPTITFRIRQYSLCKDVVSSLKHPATSVSQHLHHALLIMNNCADENADSKSGRRALRVIQGMFQHMFPSINIHETPLNSIRRCVLINRTEGSDNRFELRHYAIKMGPVGVGKAVKKVMQSKIPKIGKYADISDYVLNPGAGQTSESEAEGEDAAVDVDQDVKERGITVAGRSVVRLTELGPRLTLELACVQSGAGIGELLMGHLSPEEIADFNKFTKESKSRKRKKVDESVDKSQKMAKM